MLLLDRQRLLSTKKSTKKITIGCAKLNSSYKSKIKTVVKQKFANIFATRFSPDVAAEDITVYIKDVTNLDVAVEKLQTKHDSYSLFHLQCTCDDPMVLRNPEIWPENILVDWWYKPRKSTGKNILLSLIERMTRPMNHQNLFTMIDNLKVATYNCRGMPKCSERLKFRFDILARFQNNDIILIQETWLALQELDLLNCLHPDMYGFGVSVVDYSQGVARGPPYGGLAILYKKFWRDLLFASI